MKADSSSPTELIDSLPSAENIFATQSYVLFACSVINNLRANAINVRRCNESAGCRDNRSLKLKYCAEFYLKNARVELDEKAVPVFCVPRCKKTVYLLKFPHES